MKKKPLLHKMVDQKGATAVVVGISLVVLIGFAALAIDLAYLYVVRGELQNAADSGALAGAQVLYINNGTQVNANANQTALNLVSANFSEQSPVAVQSIERGHWSFATRTFTPNNSLLPVSLWNVTAQQLDADLNFINAVRVITTRRLNVATGLPEEPFFARIFGIPGPALQAVAVAYIGFAGTLEPATADQPIAICLQAITDPSTGTYTCGVGRMSNSGLTNENRQTAGWTNFTQAPCQTANTGSIRPFVCGSGNPGPLALGQGMGTTGGQVQTVYDQLRDCWTNPNTRVDTNGDGLPDQPLDSDGDGWPDRPWPMTLPVIDCPGNNTSNCATLRGAVEVNVVWITRTDRNQMLEVPRRMGNWTCQSGYTPQQCWDSFANHFNLRDVLNQAPATYENTTIYFVPDCTPHIPTGTTGGENYGILARIPVLVN
jgi:Flp pilus assembly protein TadG